MGFNQKERKYIAILTEVETRNKIKERNINNSGIFVLHEAYHIKNDPLFGKNSAVFLFSADLNFPNKNEIYCQFKNGSFSKTKTELAAPLFVGENKCQWGVFRGECEINESNNYVKLSGNSESFVEIPLKKPEMAVNLAVCYGHSFMLDEWQNLVVAIELYHKFGASIQQLYWRSGGLEIYNLLKTYEKRGFIKLDLFPPIINEELYNMLGYDVQLEIPTRNYVASINDCLLKYRNAKYVLVIDADELYIPRLASNIYEELNYYMLMNPNANSFLFDRYDASSIFRRNPLKFDLKEALLSITISKKKRTLGKSVIIPKRVKGTHQHFPSYTQKNTEVISISKKLNYIIHNSNNELINDNDKIIFNNKEDNTIKHWLSKNRLEEINNSFKKITQISKSFKKLNSDNVYRQKIMKCKKDIMERLWKRNDVCIENYNYCDFKESKESSCIVASSKFMYHNLNNGLVIFKKLNMNIILSENSCTY
uniref:Glycosyltransferase family 92 protein n=1 Tax=Parastrongyloides trichosuri TaxID=131310 RepID=A0A0N4ZV46_PARTI